MLSSDIGQNQKFNLRVSNLVSHVEDMTNKSAFSGYILPWVDMFLTFSTFSKILYNLEEGGWKHQNRALDDNYAYYESQHLCDNRQGSLTFSGAQQCKQKSKIDTFILMWCLILTKCSKQRLANKSFFIANVGRLIAIYAVWGQSCLCTWSISQDFLTHYISHEKFKNHLVEFKNGQGNIF